MKEQLSDAEKIAALLDNTLSTSERNELLTRLASDPEAYDLFVEAARLKLALEKSVSDVDISPAKTRRRFPSRVWIPLAAAAVIGGVFVIPRMFNRGSAADPIALISIADVVPARGDGSLAGRFGPDWSAAAWSRPRGEPADMPRDALAFRIGVRLVDIASAVTLADRQAAQESGGELISYLRAIDRGPLIAARLEELLERLARGDEIADLQTEFSDVYRDVRGLLANSQWDELGGWAEQSRLAVKAGVNGFFAPDGFASSELSRIIRAFESAAAAPGADTVSSRVLQMLRELDAAIKQGRADGGVLEDRLADLFQAAGA